MNMCVRTKSEKGLCVSVGLRVFVSVCLMFVAIADTPQGADSGGDGGRTFISTSKWPHSTQLSSEVCVCVFVSVCVCFL